MELPNLPELHSKYLAGQSLLSLAKTVGLTKSQLYAAMRHAQLPMNGCGAVKGVPRNKITLETEQAVQCDFHVHRISKLKIAHTYGISLTAIDRILGGRKPRNKLRESADRFRPETQEAKCIECNAWKHIDQFYVDRSCSYGRMSVCKECQLKVNRQRSYKITPEQYNEMLAAQGGCCKICGALPSSKSNRKHTVLSVDHCHVTGAVRGLLCARCNHVLGLAEDSPAILSSASQYLASTHAP